METQKNKNSTLSNKTQSDKTLMLQGLGEVITGLQKIQKALEAGVSQVTSDTPAPEKTFEETVEAATTAKVATVDSDPANSDKAYTAEDVRGVLANAAHNGHRDEVIQILKDHGAHNITELKEGDYAEVVAQAEVLTNAG